MLIPIVAAASPAVTRTSKLLTAPVSAYILLSSNRNSAPQAKDHEVEEAGRSTGGARKSRTIHRQSGSSRHCEGSARITTPDGTIALVDQRNAKR